MVDTGLFLIRLVFGLVMAAHGSQKLFGWFGGYGLQAVAGMFESLGFRPGSFFAPLAAAAEFIGGLLIAFGVFGPVGPALSGRMFAYGRRPWWGLRLPGYFRAP